MRTISNPIGSISNSQTSGEDGDIAKAFAGDGSLKNESIKIANAIPLDQVIRYYSVNINKYNTKAICPFLSHKGARENSPSFKFYPDTNSFYCFGCGKGGGPVEFISIMDGTPKIKSASKILEIFNDEINEDFYDKFANSTNFSAQLDIIMEFSETIRDFRKIYIDEEARKFIDNICQSYDDICLKHEPDNEALQAIIEKYKRKIQVYKSCHT